MWGKIGLILLIFIMLCTLATPPAPNSNLNGSLSSSIYSDEQCTVKLSTLNWGTCTLNQKVTKTIWLKNEGNSTITVHINATDYFPPEAHTLNFTIDLPLNIPITPGQVTPLNFTITIPQNVTFPTFTFNIWLNIISEP